MLFFNIEMLHLIEIHLEKGQECISTMASMSGWIIMRVTESGIIQQYFGAHTSTERPYRQTSDTWRTES